MNTNCFALSINITHERRPNTDQIRLTAYLDSQAAIALLPRAASLSGRQLHWSRKNASFGPFCGVY